MSTATTTRLHYRWLDLTTPNAERDWREVEKRLRAQGWMSINRNTSRVLLGEDEEGRLRQFFVYQFVPFLGPAWTEEGLRGSGATEELTQQMYDFLLEIEARGWLASAESIHTEKLCESFKMERIKQPMYIMVGQHTREEDMPHGRVSSA